MERLLGLFILHRTPIMGDGRIATVRARPHRRHASQFWGSLSDATVARPNLCSTADCRPTRTGVPTSTAVHTAQRSQCNRGSCSRHIEVPLAIYTCIQVKILSTQMSLKSWSITSQRTPRQRRRILRASQLQLGRGHSCQCTVYGPVLSPAMHQARQH